jgi:hypothetical protein
MRKLVLLLTLCATAAAAAPASAQVTDAERAGARQLFKEGDDLQRDGKFPEALDKFQRAQQVFAAPTNLLRIAECQAALGRLVESAESYRAVVRSPLPAGSPPAFQAAVDQAKAELSQVEPRVPKVTVQVEPSSASGLQMQIDGETVPAALIGEAIPLDPGTHKVTVSGHGYASAEQSVVLKEHDSRTLAFALRPGPPGATSATSATRPPPPLPPPPAQQQTTYPPPPPVTYGPPPPAPQRVEGPPPPPPERYSNMGFLFGFHLGWTAPAGRLPMQDGTSIDPSDLSGGGFAYALDGGFRFARRWYVGLTLEHASLAQGKDPTQATHNVGFPVATISSDTTMVGVIFGVMVNPDRTSAYFEVGLDQRWYSFTATSSDGSTTGNSSYNSGEGMIGVGLWIPAGRYVRILPKVSLGVGNFSTPNQASNPPGGSSTASNAFHEFVMLNMAGFYNLEL